MIGKVKDAFYNEDVRFWILMNVVIIVALPFGVTIIRLAADSPINFSSVSTDFILASFSVLFNIGAYIIGELPSEKPPQVSTCDLQDKLAEKLVNNLVEDSRETIPSKLLEELRGKLEKIFRKQLTESSLKRKKKTLEIQQKTAEKQYKQRIKEDLQLKRYGISVFFCAAICAIAYGIETEGAFSIPFLIIHILVVVILLVIGAYCGTKTLTTMQTRKEHEQEES